MPTTPARKLIPVEAVMQAVEAEAKTFAPEVASKPRPLTPADTGIGWLQGFVKPLMEYVLDGFLAARIVAGLVAEGGTGKTYFLMRLFASIATGIPYGPLRPTQPRKTLLLLGEDPEDIVKARLFDILTAEGFPRELLQENLHLKSVRGNCGPLLEFDGKGNVITSQWSDWLNETVVAHRGVEVLGLDPLRKFYGLDENSNAHAHAFVGLLERISEEHQLLSIFAQHIAKADRSLETSKITGRGAGGFSDDCRWVAAMRTVTLEQANSLDLDGPCHQYVEFVVTKNNYAARLPGPIYFKRDGNGALHHINVVGERLRRHAAYLASLLASNGELTLRAIEKDLAGSVIRSAMEKEFKGSWRGRDLPQIVQYGIEHGIILAEARRKGTGPGFVVLLPGAIS